MIRIRTWKFFLLNAKKKNMRKNSYFILIHPETYSSNSWQSLISLFLSLFVFLRLILNKLSIIRNTFRCDKILREYLLKYKGIEWSKWWWWWCMVAMCDVVYGVMSIYIASCNYSMIDWVFIYLFFLKFISRAYK